MTGEVKRSRKFGGGRGLRGDESGCGGGASGFSGFSGFLSFCRFLVGRWLFVTAAFRFGGIGGIRRHSGLN